MRKNAFLGREVRSLVARQLLRTMKLTTLLLFVACMQVFATGHAQEKISLQLRETSIKQLLKVVEKQTDFRFVYHTGTLPEDKKVTVMATAAPLNEVLNQALAGTGLAWSLKENGLVVIYAATPGEQPVAAVVKGRVIGADNLPLPGVTVRATGTTAGTLTDANGNYSFQVPDGATTLDFTLVGYTKQQVAIGNRSVINITMELDVKTLNSVTVTGYTNYSRNKSTSATTVVGADKINQVPMATFDQVLQGRVPGLVVSSGSGQPGTSARVTLRGTGTINGNSELLYIVDGVPVEPNYLQAINPSDIESVTVLKDASSKALYGSRGANGVLVVTTKKGKAGKLSVEYKSQYGFSNMTTPRFNMMNTAERLRFEEEYGLATGSSIGPGWDLSKKNPEYATKTPAEQQQADHWLDSLRGVNTNWRKILLQQGKFMEQQVSASGGNEAVRFYSSINYYKQDGIVRRSGLERYTLKNNLDFTAGKLTANINMGLGYASSSFIEREGSSRATNPVAATFYALPYEYPYAPDGTLVSSGNEDDYPVFDQREGSNALEALLNTTKKSSQVKGIISASLNYAIANGLVARTRLGIDYRDVTDERYINPDSYSGTKVDGEKGSFGEGTSRNTTIISTSGLTYNKLIAQRHDIEVSGYFEFTKSNYRAFNYEGYGINDRLPETPAGITPGASDNPFIAVLGGSREKRALASYIGVGRYTLDEKYTVNASFRYDGSSTVPPKNRWHGFYSVGLGWEAKKEHFLENVDLINTLRFRASYGTTASPFSQAFGYAATFGPASYGGIGGIAPGKPGYADYDWEYAKESNFGFDLALWNSRIRLVTDIYNKETFNLFLQQPLSMTSGFSSLLLNTGTMRNRGIEMDVQVDVVKSKTLTWTVGTNFSYNKNTITSLGGSDEFEQNTTEIVRVGLPYGSHYAPKFAGVDPDNGKPLYYKRDGTTTSTYNFSTLSVADFGTYIAPFTGGINTSVNWKGFYANVLFTFADKTYRYNNEDYYNENTSFLSSNQSVRMLYDTWKKKGDKSILPGLEEQRNFSSLDIQDASFLRLRNVNIGYNVPKQLIERIKCVKGIHVFVQAQNLYTWTKWKGLDPEDDNGEGMFDYPSTRTYTLGLNVNF